MQTPAPIQYELRFHSLFPSRRGFSFPCDCEGHVDLNDMGDSILESYLYARAVVGRELAAPAVQPSTLQ